MYEKTSLTRRGRRPKRAWTLLASRPWIQIQIQICCPPPLRRRGLETACSRCQSCHGCRRGRWAGDTESRRCCRVYTNLRLCRRGDCFHPLLVKGGDFLKTFRILQEYIGWNLEKKQKKLIDPPRQ